ncbi:hypothetical protein GCM10028827_19100 [Mucilaginibacter myungsuensis]
MDVSRVDTLRIDPSNSMGGTVSDFFTEVEYIPLETTKESLFGSISKLEITDDRYLVWESSRRYILIFDKKGKFLKKIGSAGVGIVHFSLNRWTKQFIVNEQYARYKYYDLDGNLLKTVPATAEKDKNTSFMQMHFLSADKGFADNYYQASDTTDKYYKTFNGSLITFMGEDHKVYSKSLQFPKNQTGLETIYFGNFQNITRGDADSVYYYSKAFEYSIYSISPDRVKQSYQMMFPLVNSLPQGFTSDTTLRNKRWEWFDKNREVITNVTDFYRIGNNLMFTAAAFSRTDEDVLFYNLKSGSLVAFKHIGRDESNSFLPIYYSRYNYSNTTISNCYRGSLYGSISSLDMFNAFEEHKDRKITYPPHLADYFKNRDRKDNPVILRLKLKENI